MQGSLIQPIRIQPNTRMLEQGTILLLLGYLVSLHLFSFRPDAVMISHAVLLALLLLITLYVVLTARLSIGVYVGFLAAFYFWSLLTFYWSPQPSLTLAKAVTLGQLCLVSYLLFAFMDTKQKIERAILMVTLSYIVLGLYTVFTYGIGNLIEGNIAQRIGAEISQENILGVSLSTGAVLCFYYALYRGKWIAYPLCVALIFVSAFTGSRKALLLLFVGFVFLLIMKYKLRRFGRTVVFLSFLGAALYLVLQLPVFELVLSRVETAFNFVGGEGKVDNSTLERSRMAAFGWELFSNRPLIGYGLDSFRYYFGMEEGGRVTYSHNNFIEMLVNGGLIAFLVYYAIYLYGIWKLLRIADGLALILCTLLLLQLAGDMAQVSYYSKMTYIIFALAFAYIRIAASKDKTAMSATSSERAGLP